MDYNTTPPEVFYIAASLFMLLAIVTATGKIDSLYCKKHGPGLKNGKFTWWRQINFNRKRMRLLSVILLVVMAMLLLAAPVFGLSETAMAISVLAFAAVNSVIAFTWAIEKE